MNFMKDFSSTDSLLERKLAINEQDQRDIVNLLVDQIEFANIIIINKIDLVSEDDVNRLQVMIRRFNPDAKILKTKFCQIDLKEILNTGLFNFEKAVTSPGWIKELRGEHVPETVEYGFFSFVYKRRRAFHPKKLWNFIQSGMMKNIKRSKGFFWIASDSKRFYEWSTAGSSYRFHPKGVSLFSHKLTTFEKSWVAGLDESELPKDEEIIQKLKNNPNWVEPYGDRRQEIVFIGSDMNQEQIEQELDQCLLSKEEMIHWEEVTYENPFHQHDEEICIH